MQTEPGEPVEWWDDLEGQPDEPVAPPPVEEVSAPLEEDAAGDVPEVVLPEPGVSVCVTYAWSNPVTASDSSGLIATIGNGPRDVARPGAPDEGPTYRPPPPGGWSGTGGSSGGGSGGGASPHSSSAEPVCWCDPSWAAASASIAAAEATAALMGELANAAGASFDDGTDGVYSLGGDQLGAHEKEWCDRYGLFACLDAAIARHFARRYQQGIIEEYGSAKGNAWVHAYWLGRVAFMVSPDAARELGIAHELDWFQSDIEFGKAEAKKDVLNNEVGIRHGSQADQLGRPRGGIDLPFPIPDPAVPTVSSNGVYGGVTRSLQRGDLWCLGGSGKIKHCN